MTEGYGKSSIAQLFQSGAMTTEVGICMNFYESKSYKKTAVHKEKGGYPASPPSPIQPPPYMLRILQAYRSKKQVM